MKTMTIVFLLLLTSTSLAQPHQQNRNQQEDARSQAELMAGMHQAFLLGNPVEYSRNDLRVGQTWVCVDRATISARRSFVYQLTFTENRDHSFQAVPRSRRPMPLWENTRFHFTIQHQPITPGSWIRNVLLMGWGQVGRQDHLLVVHRYLNTLVMEETMRTEVLVSQLRRRNEALPADPEAIVDLLTQPSRYFGRGYRVVSYQLCTPPGADVNLPSLQPEPPATPQGNTAPPRRLDTI